MHQGLLNAPWPTKCNAGILSRCDWQITSEGRWASRAGQFTHNLFDQNISKIWIDSSTLTEKLTFTENVTSVEHNCKITVGGFFLTFSIILLFIYTLFLLFRLHNDKRTTTVQIFIYWWINRPYQISNKKIVTCLTAIVDIFRILDFVMISCFWYLNIFQYFLYDLYGCIHFYIYA